MTGQRRGLSKERHSLLKVAFAAVAVAGFAAAWLGLASAHPPDADERAALVAGVVGTPAATPAPSRSSTAVPTSSGAQATSTPSAPPEATDPEANAAKRSRGS